MQPFSLGVEKSRANVDVRETQCFSLHIRVENFPGMGESDIYVSLELDNPATLKEVF
jgi:hypothetical protein